MVSWSCGKSGVLRKKVQVGFLLQLYWCLITSGITLVPWALELINVASFSSSLPDKSPLLCSKDALCSLVFSALVEPNVQLQLVGIRALTFLGLLQGVWLFMCIKRCPHEVLCSTERLLFWCVFGLLICTGTYSVQSGMFYYMYIARELNFKQSDPLPVYVVLAGLYGPCRD